LGQEEGAAARPAPRPERRATVQLMREDDRLESVDPSGLAREPAKAASDYVDARWDELRRLDLVDNIAELEANGVTVVPPHKVAPPAFITRLREAVVAVAERRTGERVDVEGACDEVFAGGFGRQMFYLLFEDDVFQEAVLNPTALALATYLLGESCIL